MAHQTDNGLFVTFEGSEGCGKSTQIMMLVEWLTSAGREPLLVREPGGTAIGEMIRHLLQHAPEGERMVPEAELLLFAASRAQLVREVILPALQNGRIVISDRFLDSTTVYQGVARAIPPPQVGEINRFAAGDRLPDLTFVMDMDEQAAMERLRSSRAAPADRMESQPMNFYQSVRKGYLELAAAEPERVRIINAEAPRESIAMEIRAHLTSTRHALLEGIRI
jgi:dTMP kinase